MKAAVYEEPRTVTVKDVPDAKIEHPCDILVKITTTNICGSDLHMYEGRTSFETGRTLGHENLGQIVEVGMAGAAYGFAQMGPYQGGQAELLRVPYGDFNALRLGEDAAERQPDYVMLADIFPTGYHATEMAGVRPDHQPDRLRLAEQIGAISINTADQDPAEVAKEATLGLPEDPGGAEAQGELEAQGKVSLDFGMLWFKGQRIGTGQAPVKRYNRALRDLIAGEKAAPGFLVSHELGLDEAPSAYEH
ncbi:alcohol dehydrogenase catalytic domain-containing protein [Streptomyces sp. NPDC056773]|uniref:alcohol dehydrogenase catalytic domain-containing protein n=1 Tax=unclassified Streptomyces TaxID=2593676 RepID=UPI0036C303E9